MKNGCILFLALALFITSCSVGRFAAGPESDEIEAMQGYDGIIQTVTFPSSEPGLTERRMVVYLPPSYYTDSLTRYPVMYLIHGARGNEVTWIERGNAFHNLDSLRRDGLARDFILVLPNLNTYFGDKDYMNGHAIVAIRTSTATCGPKWTDCSPTPLSFIRFT